MLTAAAMKLLAEMGLSLAQVIAVAEANAGSPVTSPVTRSAAAERQARYRERNASKGEIITRDVTGDATRAATRDVTAITEPTPSRPSPPDPPNPPIPAQSDIFASDDAPAMAAAKPIKKFLIPTDWKPDITNCAYAAEQGMTEEDIRREAINFRDTFIDKQERRPGWDRSWQRWCRVWAEGRYRRPSQSARDPSGRAASHDRRTDAMLAGAASAFGAHRGNS